MVGLETKRVAEAAESCEAFWRDPSGISLPWWIDPNGGAQQARIKVAVVAQSVDKR
jgi:hypothetical protein